MLIWIVENTVVAALLAVVALGATFVYRSRPALCHVLWMLVLIRLLLPPIALPGWPPRELKSVVQSAIERAIPSVAEAPASLPPSVISRPASHALGESFDMRDGADVEASKRDPWGWESARLESTPYDEASMNRDGQRKPTVQAAALSERGAARNKALVLCMVIWAIGSIGLFLVWMLRAMRYRAMVLRASPAPVRLRAAVNSVAHQMRLKPPHIRMHGPTGSPSLWCLGRPLLLWPESMADAPAEAMRPMIAHELSHLRRRDHWTAWLEVLATLVLWWHPLVWIARKQLRHYAELACDARVVASMPGERRHYAESLIMVACGPSIRQSPARLMAVGTNRRTFEQRVRLIMQGRMSDHLSLASAVALVIVTLVVTPSWAGSVGSWWFGPTQIDPSLRVAVTAEITALRADAYFRSGTWHESAAEYARVVERDPVSGASQYRLGISLLGDGRPGEALDAFDAQLRTGYQAANAHFERARALAMLDRTDEATAALRDALSYGFGASDRISNDPMLAELVLKHTEARLVALELSRTKELLSQADDDLASLDWWSARAKLRSAAEVSPNSGHVQSKLAIAAEKANLLDEAESAWQRQNVLGHERAEAMFNIARVRSHNGQIDGALDALHQAVAFGFRDTKRMENDAWLERARADESYAAIAKDASEPQRLMRLVHRALQSKSYKSASSAADRLLTLADQLDDLQRGNVHHEKGMALLGLGRADKAAQEFIKQVELGFWVTEGLYRIACCRSSQGKTAEALMYLDAAVEAGMFGGQQLRNEPMLARIGGSARFDKVFDLANDNRTLLGTFKAADWAHLKQLNAIAIDKDPTNGPAHLRLGWALLRLGEYEAAVEVFKGQSQLEYLPGIARYNVACAYALMNDRNAALNWLHAATTVGWKDFQYAREDPDLANLWDDPDFQRMYGSRAAAE